MPEVSKTMPLQHLLGSRLWDTLGANSKMGKSFLVLLLLAIGVGADAAKPDDVSTVTKEADWFHAFQHLAELEEYCRGWHGGAVLSCLDVFSHSAKTAKTFAKHGFRSYAYDILTRASDDILSRAGFYEVLDLALQSLVQHRSTFFFSFESQLILYDYV